MIRDLGSPCSLRRTLKPSIKNLGTDEYHKGRMSAKPLQIHKLSRKRPLGFFLENTFLTIDSHPVLARVGEWRRVSMEIHRHWRCSPFFELARFARAPPRPGLHSRRTTATGRTCQRLANNHNRACTNLNQKIILDYRWISRVACEYRFHLIITGTRRRRFVFRKAGRP